MMAIRCESRGRCLRSGSAVACAWAMAATMCLTPARGQSGTDAGTAPQAQKAGQPQDARLEFMKRVAGEFHLATQADPDTALRLSEPLLHFSNPVRDSSSDGVTLLWLDKSRPAAAASLWIRSGNEFGYDFASLSAEPLVCARDGKVEWSPRSGILATRKLADAPPPGPTPQLRLTQLRRIAGRFSAEIGAWPAEGFHELRLMPRPLYRYAAEDEGVMDGAVFALAIANDPEVLIRLEIAQSASGVPPAWTYTLARMSALRMNVRLDGREIWTTDGYWRQPRSPDDPYIEVLGGKYEPGDAPGDAASPDRS